MLFHLFSKFRRIEIKYFFILFFILLFIQTSVHAQNLDDLGDIKVEELTDDQVRKFINEINRLGIRDDELEQLVLQRGMSPVELVKLKERMQAGRKFLNTTNLNAAAKKTNEAANTAVQDSISMIEQKPVQDLSTVFNELRTRNFGYAVFNNQSITFEPNLRIPAPSGYRLGPDDELQIDVSGYSEASYHLKVSPEGIIRIPVAGPVPVNGLTIEQAKKAISNKLAGSIYSDIRTGHTAVAVTLGAIRSMKITIIGEATMPGTYTLPSLASAYNALYACGGPNTNGSYRDIEIIRNNQTIGLIDVYEFLQTGSKTNDLILMDQDILKINTYKLRIELKGEIKKPGLYDVLPGESLGTILNFAGGYTDNAYTARLQVYKNTNRERQLTTISEAEAQTIQPQKGDTYIVGKILNRFTNRISITGSVYRPGEYELKPGMTLKQLITEADGIREDAFTNRAIIHRLKDDLSPELIPFDPGQLLSGKMQDIVLNKEDRVVIYSKFDLKEGYYVSIEGEVSAPGVFLYEEGSSVEDLVLMAGGLKESASKKRVEVSRRVKGADSLDAGTRTALIFQQDIDLGPSDSLILSRFLLNPFDEVVIRPAPGYFVQRNVVIEGEVKYTGKYTLVTKSDRISDLVVRSGGLTAQAYLEGAVLVRAKNFTKTERNNNEQGINNLLKQNYATGTPLLLLQNQWAVATSKHSENVGINLKKILEKPGSAPDLLLNDGDTLRIPKQLQTVRVNGEVLYPALIRFEDKLNFKGYINGAGGFSERSSRKRSYVVYANGSASGTKSFLFFKNYPRLKPGAEIYVPTRRERERLRTGEVITIGATLVSMMAILFNVLRK